MGEGILVSPALGKAVHYIEDEDEACQGATLVEILEPANDMTLTLMGTVVYYDPDTGVESAASGVFLSGHEGPTYPNWHYMNHDPELEPGV